MSVVVPPWTLGIELLKAAGNIFGIRLGTEEPRYSSRPLTASVQIRQYSSRVAAETTVLADDDRARSEGFSPPCRLHIRQEPRAGQDRHDRTGGAAKRHHRHDGPRGPITKCYWRFDNPLLHACEVDTGKLAYPGDDDIRLIEVPAETLAVLRFSGDRSAAAVTRRTDELLNTLHNNGIQTSGDPQAWFYDPPWTLSCARRNEIAVPIQVQVDGAARAPREQ